MHRALLSLFLVATLLSATAMASRVRRGKMARRREALKEVKIDDAALADAGAGSPKDQMISALDDLEKEIHSEQSAAHAEHTKYHDTTTAFISARQTDLANEKAALAKAESHLSSLNSQLAEAKAELARLESEKTRVEGQIADAEQEQRDLTAEREQRKNNRAKIVQDHLDDIKKLDTIVGMVHEFRFEDANTMLMKVSKDSELLQSKLRSVHGVVQQALVLMKSASPEEKNRIKNLLLNLLKKIREEVDKSRALYERDEQDDHEHHTQVMADLASLIESYRGELAELVTSIKNENEHITELNAEIEETEAHITSTKSKIAALEKLIADTQAELAAAIARYNSETEERNRQLDVTEEARAYIVDNIHGMTVAETCHVEAKDCPRCLYDAHCEEGHVCGADGPCAAAEHPEQNALTCEGSTQTLQCPSGTTIKVTDASYGRHDQTTCPHSAMSDTNCHASNSLSIVSEKCDHKQTCSVDATNNVFGDPCGGTYKYLQVTYNCEA